jgi:hypothetical protein
LGTKGAVPATEQDFGLGRRSSGLVTFASKESCRLSTLPTNKLPGRSYYSVDRAPYPPYPCVEHSSYDQTSVVCSTDAAFTATKPAPCGLGVSESCEGVLLPNGHDSRPVSVCCPASIVRPGSLERHSNGWLAAASSTESSSAKMGSGGRGALSGSRAGRS